MNSLKLKATFLNQSATFNLKILTISEENRIRENFFGLNEKEQEEKGYEIMVSSLTEFSTENVILADEKSIPAKDYFADKTTVTERIAHFVFRSWLLAQAPNIDFL